MKKATAADFESAIRNTDVEDLPRFMRRMIQMRLQRGTYDPHFGQALALGMIAVIAVAVLIYLPLQRRAARWMK